MTSAGGRRRILEAADISAALEDMASQLNSIATDTSDLVLVGIQRRGVELAARLARLLSTTDHAIPEGALDITLYRDDLGTVGPLPVIGETRIPGDLTGKLVVIVDDVLYTGRTIRAALDELKDFGRPARIVLAVLVDRGGRELPIQADVVGKRIDDLPVARVDVLVSEIDGVDAVEIVDGRST